MHGRLNLRERLLVILSAALLPLFGLAAWDAVRDSQAEARLAQIQLKFAASLLAANQERIVLGAQQLLGAIASVPHLRSAGGGQCVAYFAALRERYPLYTNIAVFDTDGEPLCHALGGVGAAVGDRAYFRAAAAGERFVVGEPIVGRMTGRASLPFAMPLIEEGRVVAVALAGLDLEAASKSLDAIDLPDGARVLVADRHGHVVMQRPHQVPLLELSRHAELLEAGRAMLPATGEARDGRGESRLYAIAPTALFGDKGFVVRVGMSRELLSPNSIAQGWKDLAILGLVLLAAMALVWWTGGRMIVKPFKQILGTARRIEQGDLGARVPLAMIGQRGEFARLGAAFNLMADSLQVRQAHLESELGRSRSAYAVLDQVLNNMQEGLIAVTRDGRFLLFNSAAARMFPLDDAPVLPEFWPAHFGMHRAEDGALLSPDDLPMVRAALGEGGGHALLHVRNDLVPEGRTVQCSWHRMEGGSVSGGLVVFSDVSELQRLEAERAAHLQRLEETQRKLIESQRIARVGNWELNLVTGRLWWSDEVFALFGASKAGFGNDLHAFEQLVHPDDRPALKPARDRALRDGKVMSLEYRVLRPDGSVVWMHEVAEVRRDDCGEPVWFGGLVQDITERKSIALENASLLDEVRELNATLETRIAERTEQLRAANQELEAFSYSVSHDLRAPLAAIAGFSRALEAKLDVADDERARHYFSRIQAGVGKMEELIEALLQLSRVTRLQLEWTDVDLSALARDTVENLQQQHPSRSVSIHVQDGLSVRGDPRLLRAVIENLVGNAWKFTSAIDAPAIEVGCTGDGAFYVRDNGVGFDMAYAGKLFTAFHRLHTEAEFPGTGIGLATVRRVITRHQGRVWAESRPGAGTTFYFTL